MKIALLPRHFSGTVGRAHRVDLDHPHVAGRLVAGAPVRLWVGGIDVSRPTATLDEVVTEGEGRCFINGTKLWISIPGGEHPREANLDLVVDVPLTTDAQAGSTARPLLILGPQRCGSTALQWALDNCTAYRAPRDLRGFLDNTLEGFYLTQLLKSFLNHPHYSPFGSDASGHFWGTGLFQDCGFSLEMLAGLADHVDSAYSTASGTQGTWIDKCPGWDSVAMAPLFALLFPRGHVFFISRDPVSNVLSIMRLRGELPHDLPEAQRLAAVAQACSVWTIAHYLWRRYVRPIMPRGAATEIEFSKFRGRDPAVLAAIGAAAGLSEAEQAAVAADLGAARVPSHAIQREALEAWVVPTIWRLCGAEARRWNYEQPEGALLDREGSAGGPDLASARSAFRARLQHMLSWMPLHGDAINRASEFHLGNELADGGSPAPHHAASLLSIILTEQDRHDRHGRHRCC